MSDVLNTARAAIFSLHSVGGAGQVLLAGDHMPPQEQDQMSGGENTAGVSPRAVARDRAPSEESIGSQALVNALLLQFARNLQHAGGEILQPDHVDLLAPIRRKLERFRTAEAHIPDVDKERSFGMPTTPAELANANHIIMRAAFAVATTGSVCLGNTFLGPHIAGRAMPHLIVLLDPADIVPDVLHAYGRAEWRQTEYGVFRAGPSPMPDLKGLLIERAKDVQSLSILALPRHSMRADRGVS